MSSVFLIIQSDRDIEPSLAVEASRYLPFVPEQCVEHSYDNGHTKLYAWSTVSECARGSYWAADETGALVYQGWVEEALDAPMKQSIAANLRTRFAKDDFEFSLQNVEGDFALVSIDSTGDVQAGTDFIGGSHLYYGEKNGISVVSNRALVAATALHGGALPEPDPLPMAWLHYVFTSFLGEDTPWPNIKHLRSHELLKMRGGRCEIRDKQPDSSGSTMSWDEVADEFKTRCAQVSRVPNVSFQLTLTGGKDSRAVLGGLVASGNLDRIKATYLYVHPKHPDAIVGQRLADHYGLPFEVRQEGYGSSMSFWETLERHNFHTEGALNAWDRKGFEPKTRLGDIRGYYGEIFKSHEVPGLGLGWPVVEKVYLAPPFLDPRNVLTDAARQHCREGLQRWILHYRNLGLPARHAHNLIHRDCRMTRWVGQAMQWDATGPTCLNPIPSRRLYNRYVQSSRRDQKNHRFYYELMHRTDPWLAEQSFANYQWKASVVAPGASAARATKGSISATDYRYAEVERESEAIKDFLLSPSNAGAFFDVFDRGRLEKGLKRAFAKPSTPRLKLVFGACATRLLLTDGIKPSPIAFPSA